ncbi:hypothetical protein BDA96_03G032200 [Sorghum bicolor]|uniref:Uncharacterized protein n=2 Tax=Sorghum bicolor TaxID=4558 RepID=A0A921R8W7_SORBI|nr:hypothetical protein BDA96_03G032200 [Sorghum bicolor]OQU86145.1 hypothetical protein SORBI_3003G029350 [Sorghum bicolor]
MQVRNWFAMYVLFCSVLLPLWSSCSFSIPFLLVIVAYSYGQQWWLWVKQLWPGTHELGARRYKNKKGTRPEPGAHCLEWMLRNACMPRECPFGAYSSCIHHNRSQTKTSLSYY